MHEELIANLREEAEWAERNEWETPIMLSDHLKQAADVIEELCVENDRLYKAITYLTRIVTDLARESKWIPVTEPPKYGDYYLVCDNCGRVYTAPFGNTGWWLESNVTHWMPLPKPPKEEI